MGWLKRHRLLSRKVLPLQRTLVDLRNGLEAKADAAWVDAVEKKLQCKASAYALSDLKDRVKVIEAQVKEIERLYSTEIQILAQNAAELARCSVETMKECYVIIKKERDRRAQMENKKCQKSS